MTEFNKFNLYSLGYENIKKPEKDEIDKHIEYLTEENNYDNAKKYLIEHFGAFDNEKWFEFPNLDKSCYLLINEERVEFCAQKNHKQYYGKGWLKIKEELE